jgi:hypothetical protein
MTRSIVKIMPTGASKKRKLRPFCSCMRALSPLVMPSRLYRSQPTLRRRSTKGEIATRWGSRRTPRCALGPLLAGSSKAAQHVRSTAAARPRPGVSTCTRQGWVLVPEGARAATRRICSITLRCTSVGRKRRMERREVMAASTAAVLSGVMTSGARGTEAGLLMTGPDNKKGTDDQTDTTGFRQQRAPARLSRPAQRPRATRWGGA